VHDLVAEFKSFFISTVDVVRLDGNDRILGFGRVTRHELEIGPGVGRGVAGHPPMLNSGQASVTAQRVAAHRLTFDRLFAPYGDPAADERLYRDLADGSTTGSGEQMAAYLAARTTFFDRTVVTALDRGVTQVVVAGAGYDGRPWRYAKPGVRWFELDHPDTQRDKQRRLRRLGIDTDQVTFVPADFTVDQVGPRLAAAGLNPTRTSLMLSEGVAAYLDRPVLAALLQGLAEVAAQHSRLAISLSVATGSPGLAARRAQFQAGVAALGEPARTVLSADDADPLLVAAGWRPVPTSSEDGPARERARKTGLVTAETACPV